MSSQAACYRKTPNIRVREIPEMSTCLVFTPDDPEVYTLNSSAWLIFQLCDGSPESKIARAFHRAVEPMLTAEEARREVRAGIESLIGKRIIQVVSELGSRQLARENDHEQKTRTKSGGSRQKSRRAAAPAS